MNNKIVAIVVIVILAVAGIAAVVMLTNSGDKVSYDDRGRLSIFGNANNDDYINEDDIEYLQLIINGDKETTPLADANRDGVIDEEDIKFVRNMITLNDKIKNGEAYQKMDISYLYPHAGEIKVGTLSYPLETVGLVGTNVMNTAKLIGAVDKVVCRSGGTVDSFLFSDIYDKYVISDSVFQVSTEMLSQYITLRGQPDAIITLDSASYVPNENEIEKSGIKIVRISASDGLESVSGALTLGYLLGKNESAQDYVEFCDDVLNYIESKVSKIKDKDKVTSLNVTMSNYIGGLPSDFYAATQIAGSKNLADWDTTTKRFNIGDEWLLNEKYDADFIIHMRSVGYGEINVQEIWDTYSVYFTAMGAYKDDNYFIVNGNMPVVIRILYMASIFYPDIITPEYAEERHQYCIDNFMENLAEKNYKVSDGTFVITKDMVSV